ncbi:AMP-binding protein [Neptuniibacter sp. SY11_33]|uniref:AMP-binding protein n=1 Tax=Neptuniibacter sp. SY11_33 TaxID=3398215 RepID=UPI0039F5C4FA
MFWTDRGTAEDSRPFIVDSETTYTFAEVFTMGDEFFSGIERGIALIACKKNLETIALYCGALRANVVPLLIDADMVEASVIELAELYEVEYILTDQDLALEGYNCVDSFRSMKMFKRNLVVSESLFDDLCLLLPTSGSTGDPKCVRMSALNITSATESIVRYMGLSSDRVSISSLPLHYTFGLSVLNCALESRSSFVITDLSWLDRAFWQLAEKEKVTDLSGVPFMFEVLRRVRLTDSLYESLKCVNQAGGRLEPKLTEYFLEQFEKRDVEYLTMYGQTEASPRISYVPANQGKLKVGTIGVPLDIGSLQTDADDGMDEGELIYRGPNVCLGYARKRSDLSLGDDNNGVLYTGDVGVIDSDGFATIVGRKKRFAKIFGMSVNLDALESMAKGCVEKSAVIARDDLIIVVEAEDRAKELREYILSKVNFPPRGLKCLTIEELPFKSSGKLDYQKLMGDFL